VEKHDIEVLVRNLGALQENLAELVRREDWEELIPIWRHPGWTTPAEFLLIAGTLDGMIAGTRQLIDMKRMVIEGSKAVQIQG
jgi:hypothetical protein